MNPTDDDVDDDIFSTDERTTVDGIVERACLRSMAYNANALFWNQETGNQEWVPEILYHRCNNIVSNQYKHQTPNTHRPRDEIPFDVWKARTHWKARVDQVQPMAKHKTAKKNAFGLGIISALRIMMSKQASKQGTNNLPLNNRKNENTESIEPKAKSSNR